MEVRVSALAATRFKPRVNVNVPVKICSEISGGRQTPALLSLFGLNPAELFAETALVSLWGPISGLQVMHPSRIGSVA
jgi:hypothetical protein